MPNLFDHAGRQGLGGAQTAEYVCRRNIVSFRAQIARETIDTRRDTLAKLLAAEEDKLGRILATGPSDANEPHRGS